jgi:hypothetical protein
VKLVGLEKMAEKALEFLKEAIQKTYPNNTPIKVDQKDSDSKTANVELVKEGWFFF